MIWGEDKNLHKMLKIQQNFPKLYVVFHNLESQNAELVDVKKDLNLERSKSNFCAQKYIKNKHHY